MQIRQDIGPMPNTFYESYIDLIGRPDITQNICLRGLSKPAGLLSIFIELLTGCPGVKLHEGFIE